MSPSPRVANQVVIARVDGTRERGYVYDLNAESESFHLFFSLDLSEVDSRVIHLAECKAIFFVKSFTGNPDYKENKTGLGRKKGFGMPYEVVFLDGEVHRGRVETYNPRKKGFYLIPPDSNSNNSRILVIAAATRSVNMLSAFGEEEDGEWQSPDPALYPPEKRFDLVVRALRGKGLASLSEESYLPIPILSRWRAGFLDSGVRELLKEAPPGPGLGRKRPRIPARRMAEAVLSVLMREDAEVVSQVFLAPLHILAEGRERFLEAGREHLAAAVEAERVVDPEELRRRYAAIVEAGAPTEETVEGVLARNGAG